MFHEINLCSPQPLNLTFVNEGILADSIDIFRKNGFEFEFDKNGKSSLVSIPVNKNWTFGKEGEFPYACNVG